MVIHFLGNYCISNHKEKTFIDIENVLLDKPLDNIFIEGVKLEEQNSNIVYKNKIKVKVDRFVFLEKHNFFCFRANSVYYKLCWGLVDKKYPYFKGIKIFEHIEWCLENKDIVKNKKVYELDEILPSANPLIYILDYNFKKFVHKFFKDSVLEKSLKYYDNTFCTIDSKNPNIILVLNWERYIGYPFPRFNNLSLRDLPKKQYNLECTKLEELNDKLKFIVSLINKKGSAYLIKDSFQMGIDWIKQKCYINNPEDYIGLAAHHTNQKFLIIHKTSCTILFVDDLGSQQISLFDYLNKILEKRIV